MKLLNIKFISLWVLALLGAADLHAADEVDNSSSWSGHVSGYVGRKSLDGVDWDHLDYQLSLGIIADFKKDSWPVSIAIDSIASGDVYKIGYLENTSTSWTHYLGVRKVFELENSKFQPYVGSGITFVDTSLEFSNGSDKIKESKTTNGTWLGVGTYYSINKHLVAGFDVRYSDTEAKLFDVNREVGGFNAGFTLGYQW